MRILSSWSLCCSCKCISKFDYQDRRFFNSCCLDFICLISWCVSSKSLIRLFTCEPKAMEDELTCLKEHPNPLTKPDLFPRNWVKMSMSLGESSSEAYYSSIFFSYKNYKNYNSKKTNKKV